MKKISGIYMIHNTVNNHVYIGQSIDIYTRWRAHINQLDNNTHDNMHLQNAWNKYGEQSFCFKLIKACKQKYLNRFEKLYIKIYDAYNTGYNMTKGGDGLYGHIISEDTKRKLSILKMGDKNPMYGKKGKKHHMYGVVGENHPNYGKKFTKEHKDKISQSLKGHHVSEDTCKKISQSKTGKRLSKEVKDKMAYDRNTTGYFRVIKYKTNQYKQGFCWRYVYNNNGKIKTLQSYSLNELEKKVKKRGLLWRKL